MISLDTIFEKKIEDITDQENDYLRNHESQLTDEQKEKYKDNLANTETKTETQESTDEKKDEQKEKVKIEVKQVNVQEYIVAIQKIKEIVNKLN